MSRLTPMPWLTALLWLTLAPGCGAGSGPGPGDGDSPGSDRGPGTPTDPASGPPAGNPDGTAEVPEEARAEDTSRPTTVVGTVTLTLAGTRITDNHANEGGGAIFFVSNDRTGRLVIRDSVLRNNPSDGFETEGYPGIFVLAAGDPEVEASIIE